MANYICNNCLEKNPNISDWCSSCYALTCSDCILTSGGHWFNHRHGPLRQQYIQAFQRNLLPPQLSSDQLPPPITAAQIADLAEDYDFGVVEQQSEMFAAHRRVCSDRAIAELFGYEDEEYKWVMGGEWMGDVVLVFCFAEMGLWACLDEEEAVAWEDEWEDWMEVDEMQCEGAEVLGR